MSGPMRVTASVACAVCNERFEYPLAVDSDGKAWGIVHPTDAGCVEVTSLAGRDITDHMAAHIDGDERFIKHMWAQSQSFARLAHHAEMRAREKRYQL